MDAQDILEQVRSSTVPDSWNVWPLRVERVRRSVIGWGICAVVGFVLLVLVVIATVPYDFTHGTGLSVFATILLLLVGAVAFGSLAIAGYDIWRLMHAEEYLLVITPDDYVKAGPGNKLAHVPMDDIAYVTMRGVKLTNQYDAVREADFSNLTPMKRLTRVAGNFYTPREPKRAPVLAFMDTRTNTEVVVATDNSFDELATIEQVISYLVDAKRRSKVR
ncbi:MAG TPA: hypothetical protein VFN11_00515 [Ktedonobacterales bacterium]|jgi:hypothetical protein|nr:hypothetical protein [Ktedonobacterales bacterium]